MIEEQEKESALLLNLLQHLQMKIELQLQILPQQKIISLVTPAEDAPVTVANDCNLIINSDFFMSLILMIGQCPDYAASINIEHLIQEKMGQNGPCTIFQIIVCWM